MTHVTHSKMLSTRRRRQRADKLRAKQSRRTKKPGYQAKAPAAP